MRLREKDYRVTIVRFPFRSKVTIFIWESFQRCSQLRSGEMRLHFILPEIIPFIIWYPFIRLPDFSDNKPNYFRVQQIYYIGSIQLTNLDCANQSLTCP